MKTLTELILEYGDIYEDIYEDFEHDIYGETADGGGHTQGKQNES